MVQSLGEETGKMDAVLQNFRKEEFTRKNYEWDLKNFLNLETGITLLPNTFDHNLIQKVFDRFKKIKPVFDSLPRGLIHNDIAAHNILAKNGELKAIIDFSDAAFSPYLQNIAVFFCQSLFNYHWALQQVPIFIKAYQKYNLLSKKELELLYDLVQARFVTIIVEFNRWNVQYGEDQQRTEYINDYYRFFKKFLEISREEFKQLCD